MKAAPGKEAALEAVIAPTRAEDGHVDYDLHQGVEDSSVFFFYENWESGEHLDAHLATPHWSGSTGSPMACSTRTG